MGARVSIVGVAALTALVGCGGSSLDQNSSCHDFLQASENDRNAAAARVAEQLHVTGVESPLTRPNVEFICGDNPNETLGDAVSHSGTSSGSSAPSLPPATTGATPAPATAPPPSAPTISLKTTDPTGQIGIYSYEVSFGDGFRLDTGGVAPPFVDVIITIHVKNTTDRAWPLVTSEIGSALTAEVPRSLASDRGQQCGDEPNSDVRPHTRHWCVAGGAIYAVAQSPDQLGCGETGDYRIFFGHFQPNVTQQDMKFYVRDKLLPQQ
jgi:hypothetical protein